MKAPIARLPSNVLSPIRPPFMPPPAFAMARKGPLPSPANLPERPRLVPLTNSAVLKQESFYCTPHRARTAA